MRAELADGRILEFPDGTDPAVVQATVKKVLGIADQAAPQGVAPVEQPAQETPQTGYFGASVIEPAATIASGMIAEPIAGLAGLVSAPFVGMDEAGKNIEAVRENLTFVPRTAEGQKGLETVGKGIESATDTVNNRLSYVAGATDLLTGGDPSQVVNTIMDVQNKGLGQALGDRALGETGSPAVAAAAETAPMAIASLVPLSRMFNSSKPPIAASSKINPDIKNPFTPPTKLQARIAEQITGGSTDKPLAKYIIDGAGKVKSDKIAIEAVKQGFDQGVIAAVKGASQADKFRMRRMVDIMQKGKENSLYAMKNRPSDVAGDSLMQRIIHVRGVNRGAGGRLDSVAKSLKGRDADFSSPINTFKSDLADMGVTIDRSLNPVFRGSDVEGLKAPEAAIRNIVKRLSMGERGKLPDAYDLHRMKKYIDEIVTYGKAGEGLAGKTESILKKLRHNIDESLDANFPEYNSVNTVYSDTIRALNAIQDVAGRKMDLSGANADKATGTLLRRMMSNVQSRVNLVDGVDQLESVAKKYGGNFGDDIATQMLFADELDSVFGAVARTSLQGEVGKSVKRGLESAAGNRTAIGTAIDMAAKGADKLRGINDEAAFKTIKELLDRQN